MRKSVWILLVAMALLLAACGPAMQPTTDAKTAGGEVFMFALPKVVVDFDTQGNPSMMGLKLEDIGRFTGLDFSGFSLKNVEVVPGVKVIDWLIATDVQHIEMRQTGDRLALLVNGKPMPHIAWDDASLKQASDLAPLFNVDPQVVSLLQRLLPAVRRLGLDVVLKFPPKAGGKEIALADAALALAAAKPDTSPASAIAHFEVKYDDQGVPAILGISAQDLAQLGVNAPLALDMGVVGALKAKNVQHIELRTKPDGLYIYVNGNPLPNLVWDNALLTGAADLYAQMNPGSPYIEAVKQFAPMLDNADVAVMLHLPLAPGAQAIPAKFR